MFIYAMILAYMAENSKKILILTTAYKPFIGGSEIAIEEIIKRLPNIFFDIVTPKLKKGLPSTECAKNYCVHRVGHGWILDKIFFPFSGFIKARKLAKNNHYDFFHVFQASYAGGAAWLLKFFDHKTPLILTLQEGKNLERQNWFIKCSRILIIRKASRVTAISEYLKKYVLKIKKDAEINLIPNGVDVDNFQRDFSRGELSELKNRLGIEPGEKTVITVSRLAPKNGINDLITAMAILNDKFREQSVKLVLIGDGEQKEDLTKLSGDLGIKHRVIFVGHVGHWDLPKYLKISDIFARPSLSEGMGNAFLEAMAAGVPIIGTPVGGIPDFLKNGETGLFCRVGNPEDMAEIINIMFRNEGLRIHLIRNAQALVMEKYDWNKIAKDYNELMYQ